MQLQLLRPRIFWQHTQTMWTSIHLCYKLRRTISQVQPQQRKCVLGLSRLQKFILKHFADYEMLSLQPEFQSIFNNQSTGCPKRIECIRVDGATDEGPSHDEVRFWWTVRHMKYKKIVTLFSSRSSGCRYLNRVELQNGCLSLAHTNLFIPSTLCGYPYSPDTGVLDMDRVKKNLDAATSVYIDHVNQSPCGESVIHLFRGADSSSFQEQRKHLMVFLKGTKQKREELQKAEPDLYSVFKTVLEVKRRHEVSGLPQQYLFLLVCCFEHCCPHPLCQEGQEGNICMEWFSNGPKVDSIPLPVPNPAQPWGSSKCSKCEGSCTGHF